VFQSVTLRGTQGAIVWGYSNAAIVSAWTITHHAPDRTHDARWTLTARLSRIDKFQIRQRPLLFTAPRDKGRWCWPLNPESIQVGETQLLATLGPPEQ